MRHGMGERVRWMAAWVLIGAWPAPAFAGTLQGPPAPAETVPASKRRVPPDDQRRTVRSYPSNLGYNVIGVFTPGNRIPLLVGAALTGTATVLDESTIDYFERHPHENFADIGATLGGTLAVSGLTIGFFSAGRIVHADRFRRSTYDVSQALIVNGLYTFALKLAAQRTRPDGTNRQSFPSGHTSNAFAGATVIARHYGWKLAIPAYGVAGFIGVSRLAANRHHLSDVIAGATLGFSVGRTVVRRNSRPPNDAATVPGPVAPTVMLLPDEGPAGDGIGLRLSLAF